MRISKAILAISSNYLEAIHKESTKYTFELIGCGNFSNACTLIQRISVGSLLGISILERQLPDKNSEEGKAFQKFIKILSEIQQPVRINIILTNSLLDASYTKLIKHYGNIQCYVHPNADVVTDSLINGEVFGSLLLEEDDLYHLSKTDSKHITNTALKTININNYFSEYLLHVFSNCVAYENLETTCIHDTYYKNYKEQNDLILMHMRSWYIGLRCGFDVSGIKAKVYDELMQGLQGETFAERYVLYRYLEDLHEN